MNAQRKDFAAKARGMVGDHRPRSLEDFLEEEHQTDVRKPVNTDNQPAVLSTDAAGAGAKTTGREEFRFELHLIERLRRCAYETRRKKTAIVQEALDHYLKGQGF